MSMSLNKSKPRVIIVSGIDGSGKTTIIEALISELSRQGVPCRYNWLRYNHYFTKFLLAFCRIVGLTHYEHFRNSRVGYHNFYKSKIISWVFVWLTLVDTSIISLFKVYLPLKFSHDIIICDRWVVDILIDLEVDTKMNFSDSSFVSRCFKALLPKERLYLMLDRNFDSVRQARDENLNDKNFPTRYRLYVKHSRNRDIIVINNNSVLEETIRQVQEVIA